MLLLKKLQMAQTCPPSPTRGASTPPERHCHSKSAAIGELVEVVKLKMIADQHAAEERRAAEDRHCELEDRRQEKMTNLMMVAMQIQMQAHARGNTMASMSFENGMVGIDNLCQKEDCLHMMSLLASPEGTKSPAPVSPVSSTEEMASIKWERAGRRQTLLHNNNKKKQPPAKSASLPRIAKQCPCCDLGQPACKNKK